VVQRHLTAEIGLRTTRALSLPRRLLTAVTPGCAANRLCRLDGLVRGSCRLNPHGRFGNSSDFCGRPRRNLDLSSLAMTFGSPPGGRQGGPRVRIGELEMNFHRIALMVAVLSVPCTANAFWFGSNGSCGGCNSCSSCDSCCDNSCGSHGGSFGGSHGSFGGCFSRLFSHASCGSCGGCFSCGCGCEQSCGCESSCGCGHESSCGCGGEVKEEGEHQSEPSAAAPTESKEEKPMPAPEKK